MKLFSYKFFFILCTLFAFSENHKVFAQSDGKPYISTDSVQVIRNKQIYSQVIAVYNPTQNSFSGTIKVEFPDNINTLTGLATLDVQIEANSKRFFPVRYYIGEEVEAKEQALNFYLLEKSVQIDQVSTKLELNKVRRVQVFPVNPRVLMRHPGDSLHIEARIINNGNQTENLKIVTSFPLADGGRIPVEKKITINAFSEKTIRFSRIVNKDLLSFEVFSVNIAALYDNNDYASNTIITVNNASGNRVFAYPGQTNNNWQHTQNQASLHYRNIGTTSETFNINANGRYNINKSEFAFALDATNWPNSSVNSLLSNTWAEWKNPTKYVRIGTIYQNSPDFNINGRGIQTAFNSVDQSQSFQIGLVDRRFNLLDPLETIFENGFTAFGKFNKQTNASHYHSSQIIYDESINGTQSGIYSQSYTYTPTESDFRLYTKASTGLSRFVDDTDKETIKPSGALEVSLQGNWSKYQWRTNNYISSPYFPGVRRGVFSTDNRINRRFKKSMLWGAISYYQYQPKFLNSSWMFRSDFSNSRAEIGISFFISRNIRWNVAPQYNREFGNYYIDQANNEHLLQSWLLSNTFSINSNNQKHHLYILANYGQSKVSYKENTNNLFQSTLTYSYDAFSLNLNIQKGSFLLIEGLMHELNSENSQVYRRSIMGNYQKSFLKNKLQAHLSVMYNSDSFSGKSWVSTARLEYKLNRWTSFYASANLYQYDNAYHQQNRNFYNVGIRQLFPGNNTTQPHQKTGNIEVLVFYDMNSNGVFDQGDLVAPDRIITINNTTFVSQKDGRIIYRRVPYGDYKVVVSGKKWYAADFTISIDQKKVTHHVALQETGVISGEIQYDYDRNKSLEVKAIFAGVSIEFKDTNNLTFRTRTNKEGKFLINLPKGKYNIKVVPESLQENVYTTDTIPPVELQANQRKHLEQPIILKIKQREIKVRRFGE